MVICVLNSLSLTDQMKHLTLTIGVDRYTINPSDLMASCRESKEEIKPVICSMLIMQSAKQNTIGIPFFNSNLVVFDKANNRVGNYYVIQASILKLAADLRERDHIAAQNTEMISF